jgi:hypothetical protein
VQVSIRLKIRYEGPSGWKKGIVRAWRSIDQLSIERAVVVRPVKSRKGISRRGEKDKLNWRFVDPAASVC